MSKRVKNSDSWNVTLKYSIRNNEIPILSINLGFSYAYKIRIWKTIC